MPLKKNGVNCLIDKHHINVMEILESKLNLVKLQQVMIHKFPRWEEVNNFQAHSAGRIAVPWDPSKVTVELLGITPQVIHCLIRY